MKAKKGLQKPYLPSSCENRAELGPKFGTEGGGKGGEGVWLGLGDE